MGGAGGEPATRMSDNPSLLFVNQHYWPDVASTGQHLTDLAEHLAGVGFDVRVLAGRVGYGGRELEAPERETRRGVRIRRVDLPGFGRGKEHQAGRVLDYTAFHLRGALAALVGGEPPDLVVSLTTPSLLPATVRALCGLRGLRYGVWAMDLHPDVEYRLGVLPGGRATAGPLRAAGRWAYRGADLVVTLGPHMARRIRETKGVPAGRIHEIPVWNDGEEVRPVPREENPLRRELGYGPEDFVVMYSGNAGLAHRFDEVLEAADRLRDRQDVHFLFVGGGPRRRQIERAARDRDLPRFRYLDYFPREELDRSLSLGDLHLLTLRREMAALCAPGKLYGIMAAGRPVLMVGPEASEPGETIREARIGRVIVPRGDPAPGGERLAARIRELADEPDRCRSLGRRARRVFEERFERQVCCGSWEELLRRQLSPS